MGVSVHTWCQIKQTMKGFFGLFAMAALCLSTVQAAFPLFNVVKFENEPCNGDSGRKGTCYTEQECGDLGGKKVGSTCADGFGVCCQFSEVKCGDSKSVNSTYLISSTVAASSSCTYEICPANSNICRIKFQFTKLTLANPGLATAGASTANVGDSIGACSTDALHISTSGTGNGSPVICGTNTGQHMIMDSDGESCNNVNIVIGSSTATTREWDIAVTQYDCIDTTLLENTAGPKGCLQYMTGDKNGAGRIDNFGSDITLTTFGASVTHLANQKYNICIRRHGTHNRICYQLVKDVSTSTSNQASFGLSIDDNAAAQSSTDDKCVGRDHITIPNAVEQSKSSTTSALDTHAAFKLCGRVFNNQHGQTAIKTVCSNFQPFVVGVDFGFGEMTTATSATAINDEQKVHPSGAVGFHINFAQDTI